jgi:acetyl esterase/lipase
MLRTVLLAARVMPLLAGLVLSPPLSAGEAKSTLERTRAGNLEIPLWDTGKVPLAKGNGPLDNPFLTVSLPPAGRQNGGAVVVAPGGGNIMLLYGLEGIDIAERYNEWGVAAFILNYRLSPPYGDDARVLDGKRAIQIVRARAAEWNLDPHRVGFIGFSAGSSLARAVAAASSPEDANAADPVDRFSSRPDYLGMVYGPGRPSPHESLHDFPPTFLIVAAGDTGAALGSAQLFMDLTRAGATAELHIYQKGHHGFGSGFANGTYSDWMGRLQHFLKQGGFLPEGKP